MSETTSNADAGRIKYRKLRVAFSAVCGITCLLLIVMWVRSYWWADDYLSIHKGEPFSFYIYFEADYGELNAIFGPPVSPSSWIAYGSSDVSNHRNYNYTVFGFYLGGDEMFPEIWIIVAPFWFLVPATAGLAVTPWICWKRRFSLRTLLIAMTLVAVVLGLVVWAAS